jgi:protein-disulfide isomerase
MINKMLRVLLFVIAAGAVPALAGEFTDSQKQELGAFIHDYLMKNPEVLRDALQELDRRQSQAEATARKDTLTAKAAAVFHEDGDLVGGNPNGKITVVEFFDYNCGYCRKAFPDVMKMIGDDKDVRLVMKEFPILGPGSTYAARAALASRKQGKYWEYHLAMMRHEGRIDEATADEVADSIGLDVKKLKADMKSDEVEQVIGRNMDLAEKLNIQGTPAFIIDETIIPGAIGYDGLTAAVKQVRDKGGCQLC